MKSIHAFKTISEVSSDLGVPQHVLRFWEKRFSNIKPMTRAGGRRFYRPADVKLLKAINKLLYVDSYTIKGVQKLFKECGVSHVISLFDNIDKNFIAPREIKKNKIKDDQVSVFKNDLFDDAVLVEEQGSDYSDSIQIGKGNLNNDSVDYKINIIKAIKELKLMKDVLISASQ